MKKRLMTFLATGAFVGAMMAGGAGTALAGEVTGQDPAESTGAREHANSICAFSGQNDDPSEGFPHGGRVQSFGQIVKQIGPIGGEPGDECRGGSNPSNPGSA